MKKETKTILENLTKDLHEGLKLFGTYTFYDKGADEVFDFIKHQRIIEKYFKENPNENELLSFLKELYKIDKKCSSLASYFIECLWEDDDGFYDDWYGTFFRKNKTILRKIQDGNLTN